MKYTKSLLFLSILFLSAFLQTPSSLFNSSRNSLDQRKIEFLQQIQIVEIYQGKQLVVGIEKFGVFGDYYKSYQLVQNGLVIKDSVDIGTKSYSPLELQVLKACSLGVNDSFLFYPQVGQIFYSYLLEGLDYEATQFKNIRTNTSEEILRDSASCIQINPQTIGLVFIEKETKNIKLATYKSGLNGYTEVTVSSVSNTYVEDINLTILQIGKLQDSKIAVLWKDGLNLNKHQFQYDGTNLNGQTPQVFTNFIEQAGKFTGVYKNNQVTPELKVVMLDQQGGSCKIILQGSTSYTISQKNASNCLDSYGPFQMVIFEEEILIISTHYSNGKVQIIGNPFDLQTNQPLAEYQLMEFVEDLKVNQINVSLQEGFDGWVLSCFYSVNQKNAIYIQEFAVKDKQRIEKSCNDKCKFGCFEEKLCFACQPFTVDVQGVQTSVDISSPSCCLPFCDYCTSPDNCLKCKTKNRINDITQNCPCQSGFFENSIYQCIPENQKCIGLQNDDGYCKKCTDSSYILPNCDIISCVSNQYYKKLVTGIGYTCVECDSFCNGCDENGCLACVNSKQQKHSCQCQYGEYYMNGACQQCNPQCKTCNPDGSCSSCDGLNRDVNNTCECINFYFSSPYQDNCLTCNSQCKTNCSGGFICPECYYENFDGSKQCSVCKPGHKQDPRLKNDPFNNSYKRCYKEYEGCIQFNSGYTQCETCDTGYYQLQNKQDGCGKCPKQCITCEKQINEVACLICSTNPCFECQISSFSVLNQSKNEFECEACNPICKTCKYNSTNCKSCYSSQNREILSTDQCSCKPGYYNIGNQLVCLKCPDICQTCVYDNQLQKPVCKTCQNQFFKYPDCELCSNANLVTSQACICTAYQYLLPDMVTCAECDNKKQGCGECNISNGECKQCHDFMDVQNSDQSGNVTECRLCNLTKIVDNNADRIKQSSLFDSNCNGCKQCSLKCEVLQNDCVSCEPTSYQDSGTHCSQQCSVEFNPTQNSQCSCLFPFDQNCQTCGNINTHCKTCLPGFRIETNCFCKSDFKSELLYPYTSSDKCFNYCQQWSQGYPYFCYRCILQQNEWTSIQSVQDQFCLSYPAYCEQYDQATSKCLQCQNDKNLFTRCICDKNQILYHGQDTQKCQAECQNYYDIDNFVSPQDCYSCLRKNYNDLVYKTSSELQGLICHSCPSYCAQCQMETDPKFNNIFIQKCKQCKNNTRAVDPTTNRCICINSNYLPYDPNDDSSDCITTACQATNPLCKACQSDTVCLECQDQSEFDGQKVCQCKATHIRSSGCSTCPNYCYCSDKVNCSNCYGLNRVVNDNNECVCAQYFSPTNQTDSKSNCEQDPCLNSECSTCYPGEPILCQTCSDNTKQLPYCKCQKGYKYNTVAQNCQKNACQDVGCELCDEIQGGQQLCFKCKTYQYLVTKPHNSTDSCNFCPDKCTVCESTGVCTQCEDFHYYIASNNTCKACKNNDTIENRFCECDQNNICLKCTDNTWIHNATLNRCFKKYDRCLVIDAQNQCTGCMEGYYPQNNICGECVTGCSKCSSSTNCIECQNLKYTGQTCQYCKNSSFSTQQEWLTECTMCSDYNIQQCQYTQNGSELCIKCDILSIDYHSSLNKDCIVKEFEESQCNQNQRCQQGTTDFYKCKSCTVPYDIQSNCYCQNNFEFMYPQDSWANQCRKWCTDKDMYAWPFSCEQCLQKLVDQNGGNFNGIEDGKIQNFLCRQCSAQCDGCQLSSGILSCASCKDPFKIVDASINDCVCQNGFQLNTNNECHQNNCANNCRKCDSNTPNICTECIEAGKNLPDCVCQEGYQLVGGQCEIIVCQDTQCDVCNANQLCLKCKNNDRKNVQRCNECVTNSCQTCNYQGLCIKCNQEYYLKDSVCIQCHPSCECDGTDNSCTSCKNGFFQNGSFCQSCSLDNCTCSKANECTGCLPGYVYNPFMKKCHVGTENCIQDDNKQQCMQCEEGYYVQELNNTKTCNKCQENCQTCQNSTSCTTCINSGLTGDQCQYCSEKSMESVVKLNSQCNLDCYNNCNLHCRAGFNGSCAVCNFSTLDTTKSECLQCEITLTESAQQGCGDCSMHRPGCKMCDKTYNKCIECQDGQSMDSNCLCKDDEQFRYNPEWKECLQWCDIDNKDDILGFPYSCEACLEQQRIAKGGNYYGIASQCSIKEILCTKCESYCSSCDYINKTGVYGCIECKQNFKEVNDLGECVCISGYKLSDMNSKFSECIQEGCQNSNCAACNGQVCTKCIDFQKILPDCQCQQGYQINTQTDSCTLIDCKQNQCKMCEINQICLQCKGGYALESQTNTCKKCPLLCSECTKTTQCTSCKDNYNDCYHIELKDGQCLCKQVDNSIISVQSCNSYCGTCSQYQDCIACKNITMSLGSDCLCQENEVLQDQTCVSLETGTKTPTQGTQIPDKQNPTTNVDKTKIKKEGINQELVIISIVMGIIIFIMVIAFIFFIWHKIQQNKDKQIHNDIEGQSQMYDPVNNTPSNIKQDVLLTIGPNGGAYISNGELDKQIKQWNRLTELRNKHYNQIKENQNNTVLQQNQSSNESQSDNNVIDNNPNAKQDEHSKIFNNLCQNNQNSWNTNQTQTDKNSKKGKNKKVSKLNKHISQFQQNPQQDQLAQSVENQHGINQLNQQVSIPISQDSDGNQLLLQKGSSIGQNFGNQNIMNSSSNTDFNITVPQNYGEDSSGDQDSQKRFTQNMNDQYQTHDTSEISIDIQKKNQDIVIQVVEEL